MINLSPFNGEPNDGDLQLNRIPAGVNLVIVFRTWYEHIYRPDKVKPLEKKITFLSSTSLISQKKHDNECMILKKMILLYFFIYSVVVFFCVFLFIFCLFVVFLLYFLQITSHIFLGSNWLVAEC